jgi:hypothetical protein
MANANWSNPTLTSTYTNFVSEVKNRDEDLALQFDGTTSTNIPTGTIRWDSSANRWKKWSGSAWGELTSTYALTGLSTTGNAAIGGVTTHPAGSATAGSIQVGTGTTYAPGIYSPGTDQLAISTNGTGRVFVDSTGKVGLGTSSPSTYGAQLAVIGGSVHVDRNIGGGSAQVQFSIGASSGANFGQIGNTGTRWSLGYGTTANTIGTEVLTWDSSGRVGIGTTSPNKLLHVAGIESVIGAYQLELEGRFNGYGAGIQFSSRTSSGGTLLAMAKITADGENPWDTTPANQDAGLRFYTTLDGTLAEKLRIDASGRVGIGTTSPSSGLHLANATAGSAANFTLSNPANNWSIKTGTTENALVFYENQFSSEKARIDSSGRLLVGTSSARPYTSLGYAKFQLEGTSFADSSIGLTNNQATVDGSYLVFNKTRGTAIGSVTSVQSNDLLGSIWFEGADGTTPIRGATIEAAVDGTPGANGMPGRLVFSTTAAGSASPTERMRLDSSGNLGIGCTPIVPLDVVGNHRCSSASQPQLILNSTASGSWKSNIRFQNSGTAKYEIGVDTASAGANNFYFYDAVAAANRAAITSTGVFQFDSGYGSAAAAYGCRAWVYFNSAGTVQANGNVSSVTYTATGIYTINFTNAMPDASYAWSGSALQNSDSIPSLLTERSRATSSLVVREDQARGAAAGAASVAIFR